NQDYLCLGFDGVVCHAGGQSYTACGGGSHGVAGPAHQPHGDAGANDLYTSRDLSRFNRLRGTHGLSESRQFLLPPPYTKKTRGRSMTNASATLIRITLTCCSVMTLAAGALAVRPGQWVHQNEADFQAAKLEQTVISNLGRVELTRASEIFAELPT